MQDAQAALRKFVPLDRQRCLGKLVSAAHLCWRILPQIRDCEQCIPSPSLRRHWHGDADREIGGRGRIGDDEQALIVANRHLVCGNRGDGLYAPVCLTSQVRPGGQGQIESYLRNSIPLLHDAIATAKLRPCCRHMSAVKRVYDRKTGALCAVPSCSFQTFRFPSSCPFHLYC